MALDISIFSSLNTTILFVMGVGIVLVVIAILYTVDYQLRKKKMLQESTLEYKYSIRLEELKKNKSEPAELIENAEKMGRDFIEEKFGVNSKADFSELTEIFKDKGKPYVISFCQTMLELLYSGEKPGLNEARAVLGSLEMMLRQEGVLIVIKKKEEPVEKTNIITEWAKKIEKEIGSIKTKSEKESSAESKAEEIKKDPEVKQAVSSVVSRPVLAPIPKKEIIPEKQSGRMTKNDRKEYKYIESLDSLDRIKHRVRKHEEEKKAKSA